MANATNNITAPHPYTLSKGAVEHGAFVIPGTSIWIGLVFDGTPQATQGAGWAGIGSLGVDSTNGKWYTNTGTLTTPTWTVVGAQS